jgi:hypothetical protein
MALMMLGMLVIGLASHPVAVRGRIAGHLRVFLEQLLGGAAHPHLRPGTVEHMVAVEGNAVLLVAKSATSTATAAAVRAMVATTHALHVHIVSSILNVVDGWQPQSGPKVPGDDTASGHNKPPREWT